MINRIYNNKLIFVSSQSPVLYTKTNLFKNLKGEYRIFKYGDFEQLPLLYRKKIQDIYSIIINSNQRLKNLIQSVLDSIFKPLKKKINLQNTHKNLSSSNILVEAVDLFTKIANNDNFYNCSEWNGLNLLEIFRLSLILDYQDLIHIYDGFYSEIKNHPNIQEITLIDGTEISKNLLKFALNNKLKLNIQGKFKTYDKKIKEINKEDEKRSNVEKSSKIKITDLQTRDFITRILKKNSTIFLIKFIHNKIVVFRERIKNKSLSLKKIINNIKSQKMANPKKRILIIQVITLNHYDRLKRVLEYLNSYNEFIIVILALAPFTRRAEFKDLKEKYRKIHILNVELLLMRQRFNSVNDINSFKKFIKDLDFNEKFIGESFLNTTIFSKKILDYWLKSNFIKLFPLLNYISFLDRFISEVSPDSAIYLNEIVERGKIFNIICKKHGVINIYFPHASIGGLTYGPLDMDYALLSGQMDKDVYLSAKGRKPTKKTKILITGNPKFDELIEATQKIKTDEIELLKKKFGIPPSSKIFLVLTSPIEKTLKEDILKTISASVVQHKDIYLIFKLHPRELDPSVHKGIISEYNLEDRSTVLMHGEVSLLNVLALSDVVFGKATAAFIEAIFMDKLPIDLNIDKFEDRYLIEKFNVGKLLNSPEEVRKFINDFANKKIDLKTFHENRLRYKNRLYPFNDNKSSKRIAETIRNIVNNTEERHNE